MFVEGFEWKLNFVKSLESEFLCHDIDLRCCTTGCSIYNDSCAMARAQTCKLGMYTSGQRDPEREP
jgi:hypothetical protein